MSIDEILEEMDELLDKSGSVPFMAHKKVVDGERLRELINDIRLNMPHELKEAKKIEFDCQRILNEAKINADAIIRKAEERAAQMVSKEAVMAEAKKKALDLLTKAQAASLKLQQNAIASVNKLISDTELHYERSLKEITVMKSRMAGNSAKDAKKTQTANKK